MHYHHPRQRWIGPSSLQTTSLSSRRDHSVAPGMISAAWVRLMFGETYLASSFDLVRRPTAVFCIWVREKMKVRNGNSANVGSGNSIQWFGMEEATERGEVSVCSWLTGQLFTFAAVTIVLAMSVYQLIVSDKLPSSCNSVPVIGQLTSLKTEHNYICQW